MKKRIKIDSAILSFIIILTGLLYQFPYLYSVNVSQDDMLDFIGLFVVLMGTFLRMSARGYKKANSQKGHGLVMGGPYKLTRNPMYFGSFLMGAGFVMIVWPVWSLPLFTIIFYLRFKKQIVKEEVHLKELFGSSYEEYIKKVPRLFPNIKTITKNDFRKLFPIETSWDTKEKWGLIGWSALAVILETLQENIVFGFSDIGWTLKLFALSAVSFAVIFRILYKLL